MTFIAPVIELGLIGVADPNVPRLERVVMRPAQVVNLSEFGVFLGFRLPDRTIIPMRDNFFWFGTLQITPPSWILLYTGPGEYHASTKTDTSETIHNFYWNRPSTLFTSPQIVAVLFKIGSMTLGDQLHPLPQRIG
jgi:hypothetical protein